MTIQDKAAGTFPQLALQQASVHADLPAIRNKQHGIWNIQTWRQLAAEAKTLAAALAARGFKAGNHFVLLSEHRADLQTITIAAQYLGGGVVPLDPDTSAQELAGVLNALGVSHVYAENQEQVDKFLSILPACAAVSCIVFGDERGMRHYQAPQLVRYADLLTQGAALPAPESRTSEQDTAFVFIEGTQATRVSHGELIALARNSSKAAGLQPDDSVVAALSPALAVQTLFAYAQPLVTGHCVCFPESSETLLSDMREMGPSHFLAPVGALSAMQANTHERMGDAGKVKQYLFHKNMAAGVSASGLGRYLVQEPLRDVLGVSALQRIYLAKKADPAIEPFFTALGIALTQAPDLTTLGVRASTPLAANNTTHSGAQAQPHTSSAQRAFPVGEPILSLDHISLRFGGVKALTDISFNVREHEILAIIGPNGAGKSSMLNVINGVYRPQEGGITYRGQRLTGMTPTRAAHMGISRTFQNIALFKGMSVLDNILAGRTLKMNANFVEVALQLPRARREESEHRKVAESIIEFLEIEDIRKTPVARLPYGLQKRVELGRALAAEPKILLLDEPMAGMNIEEKQDMSRFILDVNDHYGTTVVLIEHDMGVVMDISDRVVVLDYGKKIGDGTPAEVRANQNVIDAYLGVAH